MNKAELAAKIADKHGISKRHAETILTDLTACIVDAVAAGDEVALVGFGTFKAVERAERMGRNPSTGKELKIPAAMVPKFVPGSRFKEAVNG